MTMYEYFSLMFGLLTVLFVGYPAIVIATERRTARLQSKSWASLPDNLKELILFASVAYGPKNWDRDTENWDTPWDTFDQHLKVMMARICHHLLKPNPSNVIGLREQLWPEIQTTIDDNHKALSLLAKSSPRSFQGDFTSETRTSN